MTQLDANLAVGDTVGDEAVRDRIRTDLATTLFVSAGAGSGKTATLVDRLVALVASGTSIDHVAAITFTEKAADELRHRIRIELGDRASAATDPIIRQRFETALDDLDQAAFCTLHAFAQRILTAFPVEAGLPPAITVLDEIASDAAFDERWLACYDDLASRPAFDRTMTLALELGIKPEHLRAVAEQFDDNWDRVRVPDIAPGEPPPLDVTPLLAVGGQLLDACDAIGRTDALAEQLGAWLPDWLHGLRSTCDELALLDLLLGAELPNLRNRGSSAWSTTPFASAKEARDVAKGLVGRDRADSALARALGTIIEPVLTRLSAEIAAFTMREAERRRRAGQLTFHDLLVVCRRLLEDDEHGAQVRADLAQRFEVLLIDEYQDTDPLQLDIVLAIATPPGASAPRAGQLFFVGDPKQSLYRFRRADINLFLRTPERVGADEVSLTTNFRSTPDVLAWVNHVFGRLIQEAQADDGVTLAQPAYEALSARSVPGVAGEAITLLGEPPHPKGTLVAALRDREAADVAALIHAVRAEGWTVRPRAGGSPVPARWRDIAILIPARTMLGQLEAALRDAGVPYRLDTGSLVYASDEVRGLLLALRAVEDPSDHLAVVSALRSSLYGCSDIDLFRWRHERAGRWSPQAPAPPRLEGDDPVWDAMADLRDRIANRAWRTPSEQLESIVRDRRVLETALAAPGTLDAWHRVRFVIEQARAWSDAGGRFLRDYLDWTRRQTALTGRVAEVPLDGADAPAVANDADDVDDADDAVRVLTVHGAKGLEFPIAVVCGLNTAAGRRQRGVQVSWGAEGQVVRLRSDLTQAGFDAHRAIDEQMDAHERTRLLYVACTRARDHLVVSLHRTDGAGQTGAHLLAGCVTSSEDAAALGGVQRFRQPVSGGLEPAALDGGQPEVRVPDLGRWRSERRSLLAAARQPTSVSATALAANALSVGRVDIAGEDDDDRFEELVGAAAPDDLEAGLAKRPVDLDLPAWRKGRYGTSVGRAVHAVLQVVDLATGEGVDALARAQAAAEGIDGEHERIADLARSALAAASVREAAGSEHWREVYVGVPAGGRVLEGYIDLLYRVPGGLVVVDHKTDRVTTDEEVAAKLAAYRLQLAAYALAVERATGEPVVDARLVFCRRGEAREEVVPALRSAIADVDALMTTG